MRYIFVVSAFVALAIASSVYDAPPFQSHCDNIVFNQFNIGGYCDNGTPWWTYNVQYWGTCVGLDAANKLVCADSGGANWSCRNCTAGTSDRGPIPGPFNIDCYCNNVRSQIDLGKCYTTLSDGSFACTYPKVKPTCV